MKAVSASNWYMLLDISYKKILLIKCKMQIKVLLYMFVNHKRTENYSYLFLLKGPEREREEEE
jgi:hypothetical protein